jgi:hypothetical protein
MSSGFVPLAGPGLAPPAKTRSATRPASKRAVATRRADGVALTLCVLLLTVLVEVAVAWYPQALLLAPWQGTSLFRVASGYPMLALLAFSIAFGWLRRRHALARSHRRLQEVHELGGLVLLVLLAMHAAGRPAGFLLYLLHATSVALAAGGVRGLLGARLPRPASLALLMVHISLSCLLAVAALLHVYFVLAYTA